MSAPNHVAELAQFFPDATPVRIPVRIECEHAGLAEDSVLEFGTPDEVLFSSSLPLDFGEHLLVRNHDGSLQAQVAIVAMQIGGPRTAIAARFTQRVANWIVKA